MTGPRFDHYDWPGGREAMLRFGPDTGPVIIVALPLFEEANRLRAFAATICRVLAVHGIGSVLPDFPGTGESLIETRDTTVRTMCRAYASLAAGLARDRSVHGAGLRSGALVDTAASLDGRWHLAPQTGPDVLRELHRMRPATGRDEPMTQGREFAGNRLSGEMLGDLHDISPHTAFDGPVRVVRLDTDPRPADCTFAGSPLWRRSEPDNDVPLATALADDIVRWIVRCGG